MCTHTNSHSHIRTLTRTHVDMHAHTHTHTYTHKRSECLLLGVLFSRLCCVCCGCCCDVSWRVAVTYPYPFVICRRMSMLQCAFLSCYGCHGLCWYAVSRLILLFCIMSYVVRCWLRLNSPICVLSPVMLCRVLAAAGCF
jgi:hypothetical protein